MLGESMTPSAWHWHLLDPTRGSTWRTRRREYMPSGTHRLSRTGKAKECRSASSTAWLNRNQGPRNRKPNPFIYYPQSPYTGDPCYEIVGASNAYHDYSSLSESEGRNNLVLFLANIALRLWLRQKLHFPAWLLLSMDSCLEEWFLAWSHRRAMIANMESHAYTRATSSVLQRV
ncbi:hypothetical protein BU26DRAFT_120646 [Trematosphaeria pertusa]|uniref:Uncharacterized protein n=1 Tax=Trematosphaeria pertusa TaxID=390896 RepID=A0A6A6HZ38_9PLEO|nr:uncharacterized protein BU26DRAFT_120646 [Trematosphaeria pertusa]KAF2242883.1 hypothetical protein BU26DRAFT_120646 [Trematosphaeria pertusa]